ncbi:PASTA domain-containing protein, partial [Streptomyces sparsus]
MPPTRLSIPRRPARPRRPVAQAVRVLGVAALGVALTACGGAQADPQSDRAPSASASATESGTPRYVEMGLAEAASKAAKAGYSTRHHNASGSEQADSWLVGDWRVCFQKESAPASGEGKPELEFGAVPSGVSCPSKAAAALDWPEFPDVVGSSHQDATAEIGKLGLRDVSARSAYSNVELPSAPDKWKVCFQEPGAGTEAPFADDLAVRLDLVAPRTDCPKKTGTRLPPAPKPTPPPAPKPAPATSAPQTPDGSTGGST